MSEWEKDEKGVWYLEPQRRSRTPPIVGVWEDSEGRRPFSAKEMTTMTALWPPFEDKETQEREKRAKENEMPI